MSLSAASSSSLGYELVVFLRLEGVAFHLACLDPLLFAFILIPGTLVLVLFKILIL